MGQKYTSQSSAGYNSSPPPDDGSTVSANKITWAGIKSKLADVLKSFIEAVNSQIVTALDSSCTTTSVNYTTVAGDHQRPILASGTTTISLGDAVSMGVGYQATVFNVGTALVTVGLITNTNTLNGAANGTIVLPPQASATFAVNNTPNGYNITADGSMPSPWVVAGGTADAITATYAPPITALVDGLLLRFRATAANATTTPTFAPSGLTAHTITKKGGSALVPGDIAANLSECVVIYNLANTRWELLNPTSTFGNQSANTVLAGPTSGAAASPAFRALVGADGASLVWLGTQTASSSATIDFTSLISSTYDDYVVWFDGVLPATNGDTFLWRASTNNGSTFLAGTQYFASRLINSSAAATPNGGADNSASSISLFASLSNSAGNGCWGRLDLHAVSSLNVTSVQWTASGVNNSSNVDFATGGGLVSAGAAVNAIRFLMASGNTTSGTFRLYGVRKS